MNQSEIAEGIGRSKNEIFRMMVVLEERGYIHRSVGETFQLTPRLENLFGRKDDTARMIQLCQPIMSGLSQETQKSNHLWILRDTHMEVALHSDVTGAYSLSMNEGTKSPLFNTSAGACFLSELPGASEQMEKLRDLGEFVADREFATFRKTVESCQQEDFCVLRNREANSILEVSAPIKAKPDRRVVGALTVPFIAVGGFENEITHVADCLKKAVTEIANRMAFLSIFAPRYAPDPSS